MHNNQSDVGPRPNPVVLEQLTAMVELAASSSGSQSPTVHGLDAATRTEATS